MMRRRSGGATLVELVITIVIINVAIAGVVGAFALLVGRSADPLNQTRAIALAQLYADEILARRYDDSTPPGGVPRWSGCTINTEEASRANYDDVDDYQAISGGPPTDAAGVSLDATAYQGFTVSISVACAGAEVALPDIDAKRVDITIQDPSGNAYLFTLYRANY